MKEIVKTEMECMTAIPVKSWHLGYDTKKKNVEVVNFNFGDCLKFNPSFLWL